ncbi:MAG TPA: hypothetical protein [Caudoviricetes sp.]|nr:MAG TPA: hypothetical protein [Caudoviricetes sp.]
MVLLRLGVNYVGGRPNLLTVDPDGIVRKRGASTGVMAARKVFAGYDDTGLAVIKNHGGSFPAVW